jgi:DNA-binding transcriptional MerR regulator
MEKIYYSINEISEILEEAPHTLRYWSQQFPFLKFKRSKRGTRLYTKEQFNKFQYIQKEIRENCLSVSVLKKKIGNKLELIEEQTEQKGQIILSKDEFKEMISLFRLMLELVEQGEN